MYNREKGIYPAGEYLVGTDIDEGAYLLISDNDSSGQVQVYENYKKYREGESMSYHIFEKEYHLALRERGTYISVDNAYLKRV